MGQPAEDRFFHHHDGPIIMYPEGSHVDDANVAAHAAEHHKRLGGHDAAEIKARHHRDRHAFYEYEKRAHLGQPPSSNVGGHHFLRHDGFSEGNTVLAFIPLVALVFLLFFGWICYRCCMVRHDEKVGVTEIMQDSRTIANTIRGKKKKPTVWGDLNNDPGLSSEPQVIE
ncbi:MAG: uncharacterized protein KVP18_000684 [Porospora cf. gigantea A]|uniref:uncharacterized protein n=1 Tax=Porospora cf. gigantea A TaxID=2853593 RepID=UPI00355ACA7E|nr:MAG: hypothetical protein KVP18_000684 [Porospora cf. gigantea A]